MPYSVEDAPEAVQKLPRHARDIWLAAYNAASAEYQEQEDGEARAFATAWAAVKRDYEQDEAGMWHRKSKQIAGLLPSKTADHPCAMIAFFLPLASARWLAMLGGEKAEDLHLTLAALGPVDALPLSEQRETVRGVVAEFAAGRPPLPAKLTGFGRFQTDGEPDALYLNVDAPELPAFRQGLVEALARAGVMLSQEHGFTPHITLAYLPRAVETPWVLSPPSGPPGDDDAADLDINLLTLCWGDERQVFALSGVTPQAEAEAKAEEAGARDKLRVAQARRATKYGIAAHEGGHLTPPAGYPEDEAAFGDPVNYRYPSDKTHIKAAESYFNHDGQREAGGYSTEEWAIIGKRIAAACNQHMGQGYRYDAGRIVREEAKSLEFHLAFQKIFGALDDPDTLLIEGYANTGVVDRTKDRIFPEAFRRGLDAFMKNPVLLLFHDLKRPIGKILSATIDDIGLKVRAAVDRTLADGKVAAGMIEKGILNAFSVRAVDDLAQGWVDANGVRNITSWDLREISAVTVPAHQQALFSLAKALSDGTDLVEAPQARPTTQTETERDNMGEELNAPGKQAPSDTDALVAKVLETWEARQLAAAEKSQAEKAAYDKLLVQAKTEVLAEMRKNAQVPFPVADLSGDSPGSQQMRRISQIIVSSKYDRLGDLDLTMRYHLQSQAARFGRAPQPSERFFRALMVRAAKFMQAEDELPYWEPRAGARPKMLKVPAFDPAVVAPYVTGAEDRFDVPGPDGRVAARDVMFSDTVSAKGLTQLFEIGAKANELVYSTQASYGDEWVPTLMAALLWRTIRLNTAVLPLFDQFDMPSQPYDYPTEGTDPTFYKVAEATDESQLVVGAQTFPDSKPGTAKATFAAGKLGALSYWTEEMNEDSLIATEPQLRDQFGVKNAHALEELLISGDETTDNTNISDTGNGAIAATWRLLTIDGLRHEPLVTTAADSRDGGALTIDDINATRALMGTNGKFGKDPSQLAIICDVPTGYKFEDLPEVLTLEKYGPQATVLTGELAKLKGIPIVVSEDYSLTDANGKIHNTAGNNTKGSFLVVNRLGWKVGWRRRPRIFVGQIPFSDAWYIMSSARLDIRPFAAGMAGLSFNLTV